MAYHVRFRCVGLLSISLFLDGMIIFPVAGEFTDFGPMGVSMFFVSYVIYLLWPVCTADGLYSTFVSQIVYSAGASGFAGANGSMMIEVVVSHPHP